MNQQKTEPALSDKQKVRKYLLSDKQKVRQYLLGYIDAHYGGRLEIVESKIDSMIDNLSELLVLLFPEKIAEYFKDE